MTFTDNDLDALKAHLVQKVEHGWTVYKLEGLIARMEAAEKVCVYVQRWLVGLNPNTDIDIPLSEWRSISGKAIKTGGVK